MYISICNKRSELNPPACLFWDSTQQATKIMYYSILTSPISKQAHLDFPNLKTDLNLLRIKTKHY